MRDKCLFFSWNWFYQSYNGYDFTKKKTIYFYREIHKIWYLHHFYDNKITIKWLYPSSHDCWPFASSSFVVWVIWPMIGLLASSSFVVWVVRPMIVDLVASSIGATKVARSSEISDRGRFVANLVYLLKIFPKNFFNIFKKECFLWRADKKPWKMIYNMLS